MYNNLKKYTQKKFEYLYKNSLFLQNIDKLIFVSIIAVFLSSTVMSSDVIGFIALITVFLTFVKIFSKPDEKLDCKTFELWLLAYFMIVIISLAGSTLFHLSLKGFFKTFTYMSFYFSVVQYLKNNKDKIPFILGTIGICVSFEAIAGFLQNFAHVDEISTWQDVSNLNPEEVMTRVYGTLKPYNPNLLGGYFVAGIPALYGLSAYYLVDKRYKISFIWLIMALFNSVIALFVGYYCVLSDYNAGKIPDELMYLRGKKGEVVQTLISIPSECWSFGISNMIMAFIFFLVFSFLFHWWSRVAKYSPFIKF